MAENTKIEWCDHTFNAWTGCTKVGPGCDNCYAEGWSKRSGPKVGKWGPGAPRVRTTPANWRLPLKWEREAAVVQAGWAEGVKLYGSEEAALAAGHLKPSRPRVFCSSLADVFDNEVPAEWRADLFALIQATPHLDWLLLTKRIGNAKDMIFEARRALLSPFELFDPAPLTNVWLGATVVNQAEADRDIPKLLAVPARVRFLSIEPMLGPIGLALPTIPDTISDGFVPPLAAGINWVICGGESGPNARPIHPDWVRGLRDDCAAANVEFLFKQWGGWAPGSGFDLKPRAWIDRAGRLVTERSGDDFPKGATSADGWSAIHFAGKKAAGRLLDGRTHDGFPEVAHG